MPITSDELDKRFASHATALGQKDHMGEVRDKARAFAAFIVAITPEGREQSSAVTHLEEVVFWANAGIARPLHMPDGAPYDVRNFDPPLQFAAMPMTVTDRPLDKDRVEIHEGVSYPITLRVTPGTDAAGKPARQTVMWSADLEITEGIGLTAAAETPIEALAGIHAKVIAGMPGAHGAIPVVPRDAW